MLVAVGMVERSWTQRQLHEFCNEAAGGRSIADLQQEAAAKGMSEVPLDGSIVFRKRPWILFPFSGFCEVTAERGAVIGARFSSRPY